MAESARKIKMHVYLLMGHTATFSIKLSTPSGIVQKKNVWSVMTLFFFEIWKVVEYLRSYKDFPRAQVITSGLDYLTIAICLLQFSIS